MVDLVVDYDALSRSEVSLRTIAGVLRESEARRDASADIWGSPKVAEAMGGFVDNWNRHRNQLIDSLEGVARLCATTRDAFSGADRQLGEALGSGGR